MHYPSPKTCSTAHSRHLGLVLPVAPLRIPLGCRTSPPLSRTDWSTGASSDCPKPWQQLLRCGAIFMPFLSLEVFRPASTPATSSKVWTDVCSGCLARVRGSPCLDKKQAFRLTLLVGDPGRVVNRSGSRFRQVWRHLLRPAFHDLLSRLAWLPKTVDIEPLQLGSIGSFQRSNRHGSLILESHDSS